jgi:hypothetical protein
MPKLTTPPPSIHEAAIEHFAVRGESDAVLNAMASAMLAARQAAERAAEIAAAFRADPNLPDEGRHRRIRVETRKAIAPGLAAIDNAHGRVVGEIGRIAEAIAAPKPPNTTREHFQELAILQRLGSMTPSERKTTVAAALKAGDDAVLGAILNNSALVSGMSEVEINQLRASYARQRHPEASARLERLQKAREALLRGHTAAEGFVAGLYDKAKADAAEAAAQRTAAVLAK